MAGLRVQRPAWVSTRERKTSITWAFQGQGELQSRRYVAQPVNDLHRATGSLKKIPRTGLAGNMARVEWLGPCGGATADGRQTAS
jgi:hypothetical protein